MFRPSFLTDIRQWYLATYKDRFFTAQAPNWFWFYTIVEAGYHFPFSVYAIGNLWARQGMLTQSIPRFVELIIRFIIPLEWFGLYITIILHLGRNGFFPLPLDRPSVSISKNAQRQFYASHCYYALLYST